MTDGWLHSWTGQSPPFARVPSTLLSILQGLLVGDTVKKKIGGSLHVAVCSEGFHVSFHFNMVMRVSEDGYKFGL
jgi:hypothetical protein